MPTIKVNLRNREEYQQFVRQINKKIPSGEIALFIQEYWPEKQIEMYHKLRNYLNGNSYRSGERFGFHEKLESYFKDKGIDLTQLDQ